MTAREIIETYGRRWNLETTFREMRSYLKLESTRGWCQRVRSGYSAQIAGKVAHRTPFAK